MYCGNENISVVGVVAHGGYAWLDAIKTLRNALLIISVVMFAMCIAPSTALADAEATHVAATSIETQSNIRASGKWGTCPWEITTDGTLTVHPGVGAEQPGGSGLGRYYRYNRSPWYGYSYIKQVIFKAEHGRKVIAPRKCNQLLMWLHKMVHVDLSGLDTSKTEYMNEMFDGCGSLKSINLSGLDTSKVRDMSCMFDGCSSLSSINLSGLDTSEAVWMSGMFGHCSSLTSLDLSSFDTSQTREMDSMFLNCKSLRSLDLSSFDTSQVKEMSHMFENCSSLRRFDLSSFDTSQVGYMERMFCGCSSLRRLDLSNFSVSQVDYMSSMFEDCSSLRRLDLSGFGASKDPDIRRMFLGCSSLKHIDLSGLKTSGTIYMNRLCSGCSSLKSINLPFHKPIIVGEMIGAFEGCKSLKSLDLTSFNTEKLLYMSRAFEGCKSLKSLDLTSFNTQKLDDMDHAFDGCSSLRRVYVSDKWSNSELAYPWRAFEGCRQLVGGNGTKYNVANIKGTYARIDKPGKPGYFTERQRQTIKLKSKAKTLKEKTLKKKPSTLAINAVASGGGKLTYVLDSKAKKAKITVDKNGKVKVPKKTKRGTYRLAVKAAARGDYGNATEFFTLRIR